MGLFTMDLDEGETNLLLHPEARETFLWSILVFLLLKTNSITEDVSVGVGLRVGDPTDA